MAVLRHTISGRHIQLHPRHLVGRSRACALVLTEATVSAEHATVFWGEQGWQVRDLGSRNGTWVGDHRLEPGIAHALTEGGRVAFGNSGDTWLLIDAAPPAARAVGSTGTVDAIGGVLALPDPEVLALTVHRTRKGSWLLEDDDGARPVVDGERIQWGTQHWRLHLPRPLPGTEELKPAGALVPALRFRVSTDEEYVELELVEGAERRSMGARTHHEILLALARARIADEREEVLAADRGWIYVSDLTRMLRVDTSYLRVGIYRARRQLAGAGVPNAEQIIERRVSTGQLRLGTSRVSVVPL